MARPEVLAVDGGGTRCRIACLAGGARHVVESGPANASTDLNGTVEAVVTGLQLLANKLGLDVSDLADMPAHVGLAGVISDQISTTLQERLPLKRVRITDDRPAAVRGALGHMDGAVAHCGTGSFLAVQAGGRIRLSGGWGLVLGDEASAAWVGKRALAAALEVADGLSRETSLTREIGTEVGSPAEIVAFAAKANPSEFGGLAPQVTRAAATGDAQAIRILAAGGAHIADGLAAMGCRVGLPFCLTGGIGPLYADYLPAALRGSVLAPKGDPIDGGLSLAAEIAA